MAHAFNFVIKPNKQIFKLGDGLTKLDAVGEVKQTFFRKSHKLVFHAIVCRDLTSEAIGGTNFMRENSIEQDLTRNVIFMDSRKITILPTNHTSLMPTVSIFEDKIKQVNKIKQSQLISFKSRVLLPSQDMVIPIATDEGDVVSIEPWEHNSNVV